MKLTDRVELQIPFSGFYESLYSSAQDSWENDLADHRAEQEESQPEHRRLTRDDFGRIIFDCMNHALAYQNIAHTYGRCFSDKLSETLGFKMGLAFSIMTSPKEYNFETDRIFMTAPWAVILRMFALSKRDGHATLDATIRRRHTSRDGFCSFYSNDLAAWLEKPLAAWDYIELGTLLRAVMALNDCDKDWELSLYYRVTDDSLMQECDPALDWNKLEEKAEELRAEMDADFMEENPDYVPVPPRCTATLDLFPDQN